jgi:hypothetical protein
VVGDSKLVIDWAKGNSSLEKLLLKLLMEKLREIRNLFEMVSFEHVYRELNEIADQLSKEVLTLQEGLVILSS